MGGPMRVITLAVVALVAFAAFSADRPAFTAHAQEAAKTSDTEEAVWARASSCNDFQAYVRTYPAGRHRQEADARIAVMCTSSGSVSSEAKSKSPDVFFGSGAGSSSNAANVDSAAQQEAEENRRLYAMREAEAARQRAAYEETLRNMQRSQETATQASNAGAKDKSPAKASPGSNPGPVPGLARGPTAAPSAPTTASLPPSVALPTGYEIVSRVLTPTESYLPKRDGMPTGIVLLDVREKAKNQNLCKALLGAKTATVKTEAQARRDNPHGDFLVTNWPVIAPAANEGDCVELLAKYDFDRATRIKGAYALGGSRGPFFLALDPTGEIVFLDLKDASAEDVFKATSEWMKLALASPQNRPAAEQRLGLVAGTNRLFAKLAGGFGSLIGANPAAPTLIRFNDPVKGTARQFNIYKAGVYLIGATFAL
jgi:hypothetical protein